MSFVASLLSLLFDVLVAVLAVASQAALDGTRAGAEA